MTFIRPLFLFLLSVSLLGIGSGCETLPDVTDKIDDVPTTQEPRQIVSAKGLLSPIQSETIMERLKPDDLKRWLKKYRLGELWTKGEIGGNRW